MKLNYSSDFSVNIRDPLKVSLTHGNALTQGNAHYDAFAPLTAFRSYSSRSHLTLQSWAGCRWIFTMYKGCVVTLVFKKVNLHFYSACCSTNVLSFLKLLLIHYWYVQSMLFYYFKLLTIFIFFFTSYYDNVSYSLMYLYCLWLNYFKQHSLLSNSLSKLCKKDCNR